MKSAVEGPTGAPVGGGGGPRPPLPATGGRDRGWSPRRQEPGVGESYGEREDARGRGLHPKTHSREAWQGDLSRPVESVGGGEVQRVPEVFLAKQAERRATPTSNLS